MVPQCFKNFLCNQVHPLHRVGRVVVVEAAADLPEVFDVAAMGVHVDDPVDALIHEAPRERFDVVPERRRVDRQRSMELAVVGADPDRDRRRTDDAGSIGCRAGQPFGDHVIGR